MCNDDVLEIIATEDIPKFRDMFKNNFPSALHIYSFLNSAIKWKTLYPKENYVLLMAPHGKWQSGTFIAVFELHCYEVYMFTLEKDCETLYEAIINTKKVNWTKRMLIYGVHTDHYPIVRKALNKTEFILLREIPCSIWWMSVKTALNLKIECPPEVYIAKLNKADASTINFHWPHKYSGSENYLSILMEVNGGYGVFLKSSHALVAWILRIQIGMGTLQVVEEHKRKGYGSLVAKVLAKEIAKEGLNPVASILDNNIVSQAMFKKLGFERCASVIYLENKETETL